MKIFSFMLPQCLLFGCCFALISTTAGAADEAVYKVELVVFERLHSSATNDPEGWSKNLELGYPEHWKMFASSGQDSSSAGASARLPTNSATGASSPPLEFLPSSTHTLSNSAKAMRRSRDLRVLFHQSWLQPLGPLKQAPALVIQGGNQFEHHSELEGHITLYLSRYIHILTDLWLTQFAPNNGQSSDHWPALPAIPPEPTPTPTQVATDQVAADRQAPSNAMAVNSAATQARDNVYATAQSRYDQVSDADQTNSFLGATSHEDQAPFSPYVINQIITLRQKRRMRSSELHYIDHPKIGLLVKVMPFEAEAEDAPAP